jgi:hypothetical protein
MSIRRAATFPREVRELAKREKLALVCISTPGIEFVGALPHELSDRLVDWMTENIFKNRKVRRTKKP